MKIKIEFKNGTILNSQNEILEYKNDFEYFVFIEITKIDKSKKLVRILIEDIKEITIKY